MTTHVAVLTSHVRPHYLRETLTSLAANDLTGWVVLVGVNPTPRWREMLAVVDQFRSLPVYPVVHPLVLNVRDHPFAMFRTGFAVADSVLYLEEDTPCSPDVTLLAAWYGAAVREEGLEQSHAALNLFRHHEVGASDEVIEHTSDPSAGLSPEQWRYPVGSLGLVVTRVQWQQHFEPYWYADEPGAVWSWDFSVPAHCRRRGVTAHIVAQTRTTHIGHEQGTHCTPEQSLTEFGHIQPADAQPVSYRLAISK